MGAGRVAGRMQMNERLAGGLGWGREGWGAFLTLVLACLSVPFWTSRAPAGTYKMGDVWTR